jgi:hypothetical protein
MAKSFSRITDETHYHRLPRRYSDRHRDSSAPIIGSPGSTSLHFAAVNGNTDVVRTLLLQGAHADRADKHGITPEMPARDDGQEKTVELLKEWLANKDKDLREREGELLGNGNGHAAANKKSGCTKVEAVESSVTRRLHVKESIDHALNPLKGYHSDCHSYVPLDVPSKLQTSPAAESRFPLGDYTFYNNPLAPNSDVDKNGESSETAIARSRCRTRTPPYSQRPT